MSLDMICKDFIDCVSIS